MPRVPPVEEQPRIAPRKGAPSYSCVAVKSTGGLHARARESPGPRVMKPRTRFEIPPRPVARPLRTGELPVATVRLRHLLPAGSGACPPPDPRAARGDASDPGAAGVSPVCPNPFPRHRAVAATHALRRGRADGYHHRGRQGTDCRRHGLRCCHEERYGTGVVPGTCRTGDTAPHQVNG